MHSQRLRHLERDVHDLRIDGRPLSEDTARRARDLAALWMEVDIKRACERGRYEPDAEPASQSEITQ